MLDEDGAGAGVHGQGLGLLAGGLQGLHELTVGSFAQWLVGDPFAQRG